MLVLKSHEASLVTLGSSQLTKCITYVDMYVCLEYVEEVFQTIVESLKERSVLCDAMQELKTMTPAPMNDMLEKQSREGAIQKREERRKILSTKDVAPTTPGNLG